MAAASRSGNSGFVQPAIAVAPEIGRAVQPPVVGRQIEFADAAGNRRAALDAHQPVVLAQVLADLAGHAEQRGRRGLDLVQRAGQGFFGNFGIVAVGQQGLALTLQFLDEVHLEVGATHGFEDLEQGDERRVMFLRSVAFAEVSRLFE